MLDAAPQHHVLALEKLPLGPTCPCVGGVRNVRCFANVIKPFG